jgi:hypothetical protein
MSEFGITVDCRFAQCHFTGGSTVGYIVNFADDHIAVRRLLNVTGTALILQLSPHMNSRTGSADDDEIVPVDLVFRLENGKRFCIASFDDNAGFAQFFDLFAGQIDGQVTRTFIVPK